MVTHDKFPTVFNNNSENLYLVGTCKDVVLKYIVCYTIVFSIHTEGTNEYSNI